MLVLGLLAAVLYVAIALVFLFLSASELLDSGSSSNARLAGVLVAAVFWPLTVVTLTIAVYAANHRRDSTSAKRAEPLRFSHTPR